MSQEVTREGKPPRCSVNKFAEFVFASNDSRKEAIVKDQKYPKAGKTARYREAEEAIARFFSSGQDVAVLDYYIKQLQGLNSMMPDDFKKNSIEALLVLRSMAPLRLGDATYIVPPRNIQTGLTVGDVFVSMRPDAILTRTTKKGKEQGAVKIHLPRSSPLGQSRSECIALLMAKYLEQGPEPSLIVNRKACFSVDVFPQTIFQGPQAEVRVMGYIESSARLYASMWNSI